MAIFTLQVGQSFAVRIRGKQEDCIVVLKRVYPEIDNIAQESLAIADINGYKNDQEDTWDFYLTMRKPSRTRKTRIDTTHRIKLRKEVILDKINQSTGDTIHNQITIFIQQAIGVTNTTINSLLLPLLPGRPYSEGNKIIIPS